MPQNGLPTVVPIIERGGFENAPFSLFETEDLVVVDESRRQHACPQGGYDICVNDEPADTTPATVPTENPLGNCRCAGEYWVAKGCSYGWRCDGNGNGGEYKSCQVSFKTTITLQHISGKHYFFPGRSSFDH